MVEAKFESQAQQHAAPLKVEEEKREESATESIDRKIREMDRKFEILRTVMIARFGEAA